MCYFWLRSSKMCRTIFLKKNKQPKKNRRCNLSDSCHGIDDCLVSGVNREKPIPPPLPQVQVLITDENDCVPEFLQSIYSVDGVPETVTTATSLLQGETLTAERKTKTQTLFNYQYIAWSRNECKNFFFLNLFCQSIIGMKVLKIFLNRKHSVCILKQEKSDPRLEFLLNGSAPVGFLIPAGDDTIDCLLWISCWVIEPYPAWGKMERM